MTPLTDDELLALIHDLESDLAERKETWSGDAPKKARQAVCAFANDLPNHGKPGVLLVGIKDDGSPAGAAFAVTDELLQTLASIKTDGKIVPPPTLTVVKKHLLGRDVARSGLRTRHRCGWKGASGFEPGPVATRPRRKTSAFSMRSAAFGTGALTPTPWEAARWTT